jgi:signal transduction histidine kinase
MNFQIRTRLTLQFIGTTALILTLVFFGVRDQYQKVTLQTYYDDLRIRAELTAGTALRSVGSLRPLSEYDASAQDQLDQPLIPDSIHYRENVVIYNAAYEKIFTLNPESQPIPPNVLRQLQQSKSEVKFKHGQYEALGIHLQDSLGRDYSVVAESSFDQQGLKNLTMILWLGWVFGLIFCAITGWFLAGRAIEPVARIVQQVEGIKPEDLSTRLAVKNKLDELGRLSSAFNRMMDRVQGAFVAQRSFISNVSHELRTPLASMIAQAEVTLGQERIANDYRKALESNLAYSRHLSEAADKLLVLSKIESGAAVLKMVRLRLDDLVLQAESLFKRQHPEYHIEFDIENFPDDPDAMCIKGNEALLQLALINLLDNACKYSPDRKTEVRIRFGPYGGQHVVTIRDNGPGILPEDQSKVFEPFYRSKQAGPTKGSGIGLSLVKRIMDTHEASIRLESIPEKGTTMMLSFAAV